MASFVTGRAARVTIDDREVRGVRCADVSRDLVDVTSMGDVAARFVPGRTTARVELLCEPDQPQPECGHRLRISLAAQDLFSGVIQSVMTRLSVDSVASVVVDASSFEAAADREVVITTRPVADPQPPRGLRVREDW